MYIQHLIEKLINSFPHPLMEWQWLCFHLCLSISLSTEEMGSHAIITYDALDSLYGVPSPSPSPGPTPHPDTEPWTPTPLASASAT